MRRMLAHIPCCNVGMTVEDDFAYADLPREEKIAAYYESIDEDPTRLADLYLNFTAFGQAEFVIFQQRLSIAVYLARTVQSASQGILDKCAESFSTGEHRVAGWEAESDLLLETRQGLAEEAAPIGYGAATLTAVAALESLLDDLLALQAPDARRPGLRGLQDKWAALLDRTEVNPDNAERLATAVRKVAKRRNAFAHELTGSYWNENRRAGAADTFSAEDFDDTLHTIGRLAHALDDLLSPV